MGFILEKYSGGAAGLVVSFQQTADSDVFCTADSVNEALEYFGLYTDENGGIKVKDANEEAMGDLGINQCIQPHTSQADWMPPAVPALWRAFSGEQYPEWVQPLGAHDAYGKGDTVTHNGKKWTSDLDGNTWEPGVYGWTEVQEPTAGEEANE